MLPRIGQEAAQTTGFHGWIRGGGYQPADTNANAAISLERVDVRNFVPFANHDFERFALSSRESFSVALLERTSHQLAGWPLLKLYYASFFAAHAVMRALGSGVVKIDGPSASYLTEVLKLYDPNTAKLKGGAYVFRLVADPSSPGLASITLKPAPEGAGVHDGFWRLFCDFLGDVAKDAVANGAVDAQDFFATAGELTDVIKAGGSESGVWLSGMRNEINYQHKYDAWFPIPGRAKILDVLDEAAALSDTTTIRLDRSKRKDPVGAFVSTTRFLACLNVELSDLVAVRSTANSAFGQKWRRLATALP
ncbi:hypothetical protein [Phyllobacterium sp. 1468]|uniref:hypothetical protein n=1 Tax=Phyllobacterium sp. 1468 TaxID=2817759 RepID=UPI00286B12F0|nr:hypothetical protein [Phyllobacterium sp. 1468]